MKELGTIHFLCVLCDLLWLRILILSSFGLGLCRDGVLCIKVRSTPAVVVSRDTLLIWARNLVLANSEEIV